MKKKQNLSEIIFDSGHQTNEDDQHKKQWQNKINIVNYSLRGDYDGSNN